MICRCAQWLCLAVLLAALFAGATPLRANEIDLVPARTQSTVLPAGKSQSFGIALHDGDFVQLKVNAEQAVALIVYLPEGRRFRGTEFGPGEGRFTFVAVKGGQYRVELSGSDKTVEARCSITVEEILSQQARLAPPPAKYQSPRIEALRAALKAGRQGSVQAFWKEMKKQGAPILEPLPNDNRNMLVTFVWKGTAGTQNVFVIRLPFAAAAPEDYFMTHLSHSDVWYKTLAIDRTTRFEYSIAPNVPQLPPISEGLDNRAITLIAAGARTDPLNPKVGRVDKTDLDSPDYAGRSYVEMPGAPPQPWIVEQPDVPAGKVEMQTFPSTLLKNQREIAIYLPPGYSVSAKPYPLLLLFDEVVYLGNRDQVVLVPTPTILNNLIKAGKIPAVVALLIGNVPGGRDRELGCNRTFSDSLVSELLPWAHARFNFTADPSLTVVGGLSLGAVAAMCAALHHPEAFGNVLSQSGAFWWKPPQDDGSSSPGTESEPNWMARKFAATPKLPLRLYLCAGTEEIDFSTGGGIVFFNRGLRDVLRAKGYDVVYQEFAGDHDYLGWRGTLPDGLITLVGSSQPHP